MNTYGTIYRNIFVIFVYFSVFVFATIIEIDERDIAGDLSKTKYSLIYFYSDTCQYCKIFDSDFQAISSLYNKDDDDDKNDENDQTLQIIKVNAVKNKRLSKLFSVNKYPTISLLEFESKKIIPYTKDRNLQNLIEFLQENTGQLPNYSKFDCNLIKLNNLNYEIHLNNSFIVFIANFLPDWQDYELPTHFIHKFDKVKIVDLQDNVNEILSYYQFNQFPLVTYFKLKNNFKHQHVTELDEQVLQDFITNVNDPDNWVENYTYSELEQTQSDYLDDEEDDYIHHIEL